MTEKQHMQLDLEGEPSVTFYYIKNPQFRVIHVDGVIGALTPADNIHMAMFSERPAIPQEVTHTINPGGTLGPRVGVESKSGMVREMDVDVVLSLSAARAIQTWLTQRISELEIRLDKQNEAESLAQLKGH